jgi:hypothetical protein
MATGKTWDGGKFGCAGIEASCYNAVSMANTFAFSRAHLIYGICLPLALIVGYLMADPLDSGTMAVVVLVLCVLSIPLLMRWHHPLLVFSCNAVICFNFLPGRPLMWMLMTVVSLFFSLLSRSVGQELRFFQARGISQSLIFIAVVVMLTGHFSGGIGFASLGGANFGGRKYFSLITSILLYFAISTQYIARSRANLYLALYFLSSLTALVGFVAAYGGPAFYFLVEVFPIEGTISETVSSGDPMASQVTRLGEFSNVAVGVCCLLLAWYGLKGVLDMKRPWRLAALGLAIIGALSSGFRSNLALILLTLFATFYMEGLFRTRYVVVLVVTLAFGAAVLIPNAHKLPLGMQRAISFLPLDIDPVARDSAESSTQWRLDMWKMVLPDVPKYLIKGKGYSLNPDELYMLAVSTVSGYAASDEMSMMSGDYHSGPLSVIVPFGIFGVIGFVWFLAASWKALRLNYLHGDQSLRRVNTLLFVYFVVRIVIYVFVYGSFYSDLGVFTSIVGLSLSLNRGVCQPAEEPEEEMIEGPEFAGI